MRKDLATLITKLVYFFKKLCHGECPDCHVLLKPVNGWNRSDCPKCGKHFKDW